MLGIDLKAARSAWTYALIVMFLFGIFIIRKTLLMFIISLMFAYLLYPLVESIDLRLVRKQRILAVAIPFVLISGFLAGFGWIIKPHIRNEIEQFTITQKHEPLRARLAGWTVWGVSVGQAVVDNSSAKQVVEMFPQFRSMINFVARQVEHVFIIPILSFLFLLEGPKIRDDLWEVFFHADHGISLSREARQAVENITKDAHILILQYMRALLLLCFATLIAFTVALNWMGVRYATLLALFAALWEFVPLVGPLISATAIILVTEVGISQPTQRPHLLWVIAFLGGYRLFQDYLLSPHLMKKGVNLHPILVMFGVFAGGEIGGVSGIFLSVPVLALARLAYYEWRKHRIKLKSFGLPKIEVQTHPR